MMLIKFKVAGADKSVWINPEQVSGILASATDTVTIYLVGGVEQRISGNPDDIAREIDEAQRKLADQRPT
jgi:hypothetical protein